MSNEKQLKKFPGYRMRGPLVILMASLGLAACQGLEMRDDWAGDDKMTGVEVGKPKAGGDLLAIRKEAEQHYEAQDYAKALPLYERLVKGVPGDALSWFQLGNVQARLKLNNQAVKSYEQAVQLDPNLSKAWHNMGLLQLQQSANSFTQMAQLTKEEDPLSDRAMKMSQGTLALLDRKAEAGAAKAKGGGR